MSYKFIFFVGMRYFRAKKNERFISFISKFSLIGIAIGVAALIIVTSVMNGFKDELAKNIIELNSDITIYPDDSKSFYEPNTLIQNISKNHFVNHIIPVIEGFGLAISDGYSEKIQIQGLTSEGFKMKDKIFNNITNGNRTLDSIGEIIIGDILAKKLGNITIGSNIKIMSSNFVPTPLGFIPRTKDCILVGIFSTGFYDYDANVIITSNDTASALLSLNNVNKIEVYTNDFHKAALYANELQKDIYYDEGIVTNWQTSYANIFNALKVERVAMFTILSLIVLVAAFNIISTLFILVKDKTKDIAILKTLGATQKEIMLIFILNGVLIGIIGTVIGVIVGTGFAMNIDSIKNLLEHLSGIEIFDYTLYFLKHLPSKIEINNIISISSMSIVLSIIATIYPAYKASKIDPIEAMRYE